MAKVYFIRHAPTAANLSGEMKENYDQYDIEPFDAMDWWKKLGNNIECSTLKIWVSPTVRCHSTAKNLFLVDPQFVTETDLLKELDCSSLGNKKFWEISKEEFDEICHPDLDTFDKQVSALILKILGLELKKDEAIICVTHGLFVRYLYNKLTGKGDSELYDLINSKTFQFRNLDMMECNTYGHALKVKDIYRYG